jgi:hypothetical protein
MWLSGTNEFICELATAAKQLAYDLSKLLLDIQPQILWNFAYNGNYQRLSCGDHSLIENHPWLNFAAAITVQIADVRLPHGNDDSWISSGYALKYRGTPQGKFRFPLQIGNLFSFSRLSNQVLILHVEQEINVCSSALITPRILQNVEMVGYAKYFLWIILCSYPFHYWAGYSSWWIQIC